MDSCINNNKKFVLYNDLQIYKYFNLLPTTTKEVATLIYLS